MTIHIIAVLYNDEGPSTYRLAMVIPCTHDTVVPSIGDTVSLYNNSQNLGRVKVVERNFNFERGLYEVYTRLHPLIFCKIQEISV